MAGFSFKQFHVDHDLCGMKVGTDGVLLGAWADCYGCERILDVGTGSGLIALMLAQRTGEHCQVDAIDIDSDACRQAGWNFANCPWPQRLHVEQADVACWNNVNRYDLLVSNPPYFSSGPDIDCEKRQNARYVDRLDGNRLLDVGKHLLHDDGSLALILPYGQGMTLMDRAIAGNWHLVRSCAVITKPGQTPHRLLLELSRTPGLAEESELELHDIHGGYSEQFILLAREFYLRM